MTKNQERVFQFLKANPSYLKTGKVKLAYKLKVSPKDVIEAKKALKRPYKVNVEWVKGVDDKSTTTKKLVNVALVSSPLDSEKATQLIENEVVKFKSSAKSKFKRLFFDIETSPNLVFSWNVGYKLNISHENILQERAIICICWKWAGESKVHSLHWNNGDDKELLIEFMKVLNSADEIIGHNSDNFDIKWVRTRCIYHGIQAFPNYQSVDTLKLARSGFRFNSNKLDYLGGFLGVGRKMDTGGFGLWKSIVLDNDEKAMDKMVKYCKVDVIRLEQVYDKLNPYSKHKSHVGVALGKDECSCPNCGSERTKNQGFRYLAAGTKKQVRLCLSCGKSYTLSKTKYERLED